MDGEKADRSGCNTVWQGAGALLNMSRDSEQREVDEFEEEERRLLQEETKVGGRGGAV